MYIRFVQSVSRAALIFVLGLFVPLAAAQNDVPKWSVYEMSFTVDREYFNPYTDPGASFKARFEGPDGSSKTIAGFWDGGKIFKIRFTPTIEGTWSYRTSAADPGLNDKSGKLACVAPSAGRHGFLRIDKNYPYSFVWDDGTRYFMWGKRITIGFCLRWSTTTGRFRSINRSSMG